MTHKSTFSENDWKLLIQAPSIAGMYITLASPSIGDSIKESMAIASKIADVAKGQSGGELVSEIVAEFKDFSSIRSAQPQFESRDMDGMKSEALASLRSAAQAASSGTGAADAAEYRQWVYDIAIAAANAAKEGDVLGIGGVRVNEAEEAALADIASALGISA
ncbi:MAG: hypothetical protein AAF702_13735 [Chloroflexota bacterium]